MKKSVYFLPCLMAFLMLFFCACQSSHQDLVQEAEALYAQTKHYHCQLQHLHQESKKLWDAVADSLSVGLPKDMPADERKNMVAVRNSSLIQMFEVFDSLDTSIQHLVESAGQEDAQLAEQMRLLKDSIEMNENRTTSLLQAMEADHQAVFVEWKAKFGVIHCD